ncbi:MAG: hypothetical protein SWX82_05225 [Cyanobacteriota bacterium]|nr:hypothetical protein [Cyanobacteriota bacterium]
MQKECNQNNCLWVKDNNNRNHYMCLKCGRERWLSKRRWRLSVLLILLKSGLFIVLKTVLSALFLD